MTSFSQLLGKLISWWKSTRVHSEIGESSSATALLADTLEPRILFSATPVAEVESNDSIATAQVIPPGEFAVENDGAVVGSDAVPHVSVEGTGDDTFDYYSFQANAGAQVVIDIDDADFDTEIFLYDAGGTLLASNDDFLEPGNTGSDLSSFLGAQVGLTGTYTVAIGAFDSVGGIGGVTGDAPPVGSSYTMHISIYPTAPTTTAVIDGAGNLVITDTGGDHTDDNLVVSFDSFANTTQVSDFTNGFFASFDNAAITGDIIVNTLGGSDTLRIETDDVLPNNIVFNGGAGRGSDELVIANGPLGASFNEVVFNFENEHNGDINLDGSTITYTGLEPITSSVTASSVTLNYLQPIQKETINVKEAGAGMTFADSNWGESLTFSNPTDSLTINSGDGADDIFIKSFGAGFAADLTIDGGTNDNDFVSFGANVTLAADNNVNITAEQVQFITGAGIETSGTGSITVTAGAGGRGSGIDMRNTTLLTTGTGDITLDGQGSVGITRPDVGNGVRGHSGVRVSSASTISTTGGGDIVITGIAGKAAPYTAINKGVSINERSSISAGLGGSVSITGSSPSTGVGQDYGIFFGTNSSVNVVDGDLDITGTSGGFGNFSRGVLLSSFTTLTSSGAGDITVVGEGDNRVGSFAFFSTGITLSNADIIATGSGGNITLEGTGNTGKSFNYGVELSSGSSLTSASGSIDIDGDGGGRDTQNGIRNFGVYMTPGTSMSVAGSNTITIDGTGGTGPSFNDGIQATGATFDFENGDFSMTGTGTGSTLGYFNRGVVLSGSAISGSGSGAVMIEGSSTGRGTGNSGIDLTRTTIDTSTGSGTPSVTLVGTGSTNGTLLNQGVKLTVSTITTGGNGDIDIDGTGGGNGTQVLNNGVSLQTGSSLSVSGTGTITIDGTAGNGTTLNRGVYMTGGSSVTTVDGDLTVTGTAAGSASLNRGVEMFSSNVASTGTGSVSLEGVGSLSGAGVFNTGTYVANSTVSATTGSLSITGNGGTGSSLNDGVRIQGSSVTTSGVLSLLGTANANTKGVFNSGVHIFLNSTINGSGASSITGFGGGGTLLNHGVSMNLGITSNVPLGSITGTAGAGNLSKDLTGNFF